ncbi:hypothetical protein [Granulicella mallensis]|uniref:Uncharacterized protein n=1 Tax=Granulicella mallensis (strain ATCC BAA-1857 / DSM 23137 / MP5ACTX8) TaxID=682795 RepID=G8NPD1_GRAMM|nr:hypothetical protein [Granulicella mallensis]AEU34851.1 hypothetical protein AciX8_0500 [Granulicella mallensis MP5ACTX8]
MEKRILSDTSRFLRVSLVLLAMLAATAIADRCLHATFRYWLIVSAAPIVLGGCGTLLLFYLAMKLKRQVLKLPKGL